MSHHFQEHSGEYSTSQESHDEDDFSSEHDSASFSGDCIIGSSIESSEHPDEEASSSCLGSSESITGHHEKGGEQSSEQACHKKCCKNPCQKKHVKRKKHCSKGHSEKKHVEKKHSEKKHSEKKHHEERSSSHEEDQSRGREKEHKQHRPRSQEWRWNQEWDHSKDRSKDCSKDQSKEWSSSSCCEPFDCHIPREYRSCLTPCEEVNFVLSKAQGIFKAVGQSAGITYQLDVFNIDRATRATIELGHPGQNGPIVVNLYHTTQGSQSSQSTASTQGGQVNGTLAHGTITQAHLTGPLAGECLDELIKLMNQGLAYVNVYTEVYPLGEIRGQIRGQRCQ